MKVASAFSVILALSSSVRALTTKKPFRFGQRQMSSSIATAAAPKMVGRIDLDISEIFEGNEKFISDKLAQDPSYFDKLGTVHAPKYLYIGCVDARAPPNMIMGTEAGSMLTVRNIANMVVNNDLAVMSAIQFGINVLQIPHVVVCGHYECGGIKASVANVDHAPPLSIWLRNLRDVYRLHARELDNIRDPEARHRRLVDLNVIEQCVNLYKTGVIQAKRVDSFKSGARAAIPRVHPVVFDPKTGVLKKLQVDFDKYMKELNSIYDLYELENSKIPT